MNNFTTRIVIYIVLILFTLLFTIEIVRTQTEVYIEQDRSVKERLENFKRFSLIEKLRELPIILRELQDSPTAIYAKATEQWEKGNYYQSGKIALCGLVDEVVQDRKEKNGK